MIKYYESLLLYEKSILVILEAVYSSRFIKVLRPYLNVTRVALLKYAAAATAVITSPRSASQQHCLPLLQQQLP